ncbi:alanine racemase [Aeromicrobium sp. IC_218]|uniref:alanine racemase n=1 Tax=Aeromicrobium sp. IC_218 TaxID=2545468 RepID=UPI00103FEA61|nr:alanine racemase [Aeromicrobium sp. IC_218]TCI97747.1 alanine racemase [Aeromicrobium sp. IC_218]
MVNHAQLPQAEAVVDLGAYRANLEALAAAAPGAELMAVVKADAYGHGVAALAPAARQAGATWLGVATIDEALALRHRGDTGRVLCWLSAPGGDFAAAVSAGVEVTASSVAQLEEILTAGTAVGLRPRVQLKVDTGLSRNGAHGEEWFRLLEAARAAQDAGRVHVTGVWSHLAASEEPDHPANDLQEQAFAEAVAQMESAGLEPGLRHLANSGAILTRPSVHLDLVRAGIASYGYSPDPALQHDVLLRPVMTLRARLAQVKRVPAGTSVSYGWTWTAEHDTTLGLVPIGYAEGIMRSVSNRATLLHRGVRVPLVGKVCMDQLVVDLGDGTARRGDAIVLWGPGDDGEPTADDWARDAGTISYEVVTRLGGRIVRTYRGAEA